MHEGETQGAFSRLEQETQEALSELEEETQETFSEREKEQQQKKCEAGLASGSANWEGPALPALRKLTIDDKIPPILPSRTISAPRILLSLLPTPPFSLLPGRALVSINNNTREKPTVILYSYINRHAGTPNKNKTKT